MHEQLHPGEIIKDEIQEMGLNIAEAANKSGVTEIELLSLINCESKIDSNMALALSKLFNTSVQMWLNLQIHYDLNVAREK